ncbi:hypothetical protein BJ138DRAFT_976062, partial [Hygrophoropsis aurantiaca]
RLQKDWTSPVYAFFHPDPLIEYVDGRRVHVFKCAAKSCKHRVRRYLDTGDATSTGNLRKHVKSCWGEEVLDATKGQTAAAAREGIVKNYLQTGTITAAFERKGKGKVTFSHRQHTKTESRLALTLIAWTGRPEYYIPSSSTVSRDVKLVFARTRQRIARMLQQYEGELNFATDAWTSTNHKAFVAVSVHLEHDGKPVAMILDIVEVAKSHTGANLAEAF